MQARRPDIQNFWNRFIAAAAFLLTAVVTIGVEAQARETRGARTQLKHHEAAAIAQQHVWPVSVEADDTQFSDGTGLHLFTLLVPALIAPKVSGVFGACGHDAPALPPHAREGQARAPPSI
jgi:hypothetical protein